MNNRVLEYRIWRDKRRRMWYDPNFKLISAELPTEYLLYPPREGRNKSYLAYYLDAIKSRLIYGDSC